MWSDQESQKDYLNFSEVSQLAVGILTTPHMLPISLGIFGNWGAGKSSLLNLIEKDLEQAKEDFITIKFDAWLYQGFDDARAALLETIIRSLEPEVVENKNLLNKVGGLITRVKAFRALGLLGEGIALAKGFSTGGLILQGANAFQSTADSLLNSDKLTEDNRLSFVGAHETPPQLIEEFRKQYSEILQEINKPLVVIIDNLDRCLPAKAIQTLEAIRLFLFLPKTAFIIAADEEMIRSSVSSYFVGTTARHQIDYLDKLVQVPIRVPKAGVREIRAYLFMLYAIENGIDNRELEELRLGLENSLQNSWNSDPITTSDALNLTKDQNNDDLKQAFDLANRIAPILASSPIIHGNPRIVKRLLNVVSMRLDVAKRRKMPLDVAIITKLVIFERCAGADATSELYKLIDRESGKPKILRELENPDLSTMPSHAPDIWKSFDATNQFILDWSRMEPKLSSIDLRAAVYLSRETMPIGVYQVGLSPKGKEALQVLAETKNIASIAGKNAAKSLSPDEQILVMEGLVGLLRPTSSWSSRPSGFAGACLLAEVSIPAAELFRNFINSLDVDQLPWMESLLSKKEWYKG